MQCKLGLHKTAENTSHSDDKCCDDLKKELELLAAAEPYTTFLNSYNS